MTHLPVICGIQSTAALSTVDSASCDPHADIACSFDLAMTSRGEAYFIRRGQSRCNASSDAARHVPDYLLEDQRCTPPKTSGHCGHLARGDRRRGGLVWYLDLAELAKCGRSGIRGRVRCERGCKRDSRNAADDTASSAGAERAVTLSDQVVQPARATRYAGIRARARVSARPRRTPRIAFEGNRLRFGGKGIAGAGVAASLSRSESERVVATSRPTGSILTLESPELARGSSTRSEARLLPGRGQPRARRRRESHTNDHADSHAPAESVHPFLRHAGRESRSARGSIPPTPTSPACPRFDLRAGGDPRSAFEKAVPSAASGPEPKWDRQVRIAQ